MSIDVFAQVLAEVCLALGASTEILRDNLCIVDEKYYNNFYMDYCGGSSVYGGSYNIQTVDMVQVTSSVWITSVTVDFICETGVTPDALCFGVYAGGRSGCATPEEDPYTTREIQPVDFAWLEFEDSVYEAEGRRAIAGLREPCMVLDGCWYLSLQPVGEHDISAALCIRWDSAIEQECIEIGQPFQRDGRTHAACCASDGDSGFPSFWRGGEAEPDTISMRVEGIRTGDCAGSELVRAKCRMRDGEQVGDLIVKVRGGQPDGAVTALLDPPDPKSMSIPLDNRGRGKGKFRGVPLGEHRVFGCDSIVDVTCAP